MAHGHIGDASPWPRCEGHQRRQRHGWALQQPVLLAAEQGAGCCLLPGLSRCARCLVSCHNRFNRVRTQGRLVPALSRGVGCRPNSQGREPKNPQDALCPPLLIGFGTVVACHLACWAGLALPSGCWSLLSRVALRCLAVAHGGCPQSSWKGLPPWGCRLCAAGFMLSVAFLQHLPRSLSGGVSIWLLLSQPGWLSASCQCGGPRLAVCVAW